MNGQKGLPGVVGMGAAIGLCAAVGVVLGAILNNLTLGLCAGAGIGVVVGAVAQMRKDAKK